MPSSIHDMRSLMNINTQIAATGASAPAAPDSARSDFGSWGKDKVTISTIERQINCSAMVATQLRHVLDQHAEVTYAETKHDNHSIFHLKGPAHILSALEQSVSKRKPVEEEEVVKPGHNVDPSPVDKTDAHNAIGALVKHGDTDGHDETSAGIKYSWDINYHDALAEDEFTKQYIGSLIQSGHNAGENPRWELTINFWGDTLESAHEIDEESEELTYADSDEVHHTEYDAPAEGSKVVDQSGRMGTMINHEPSRYGSEYAPDIFVEWADEPGSIYRVTTDDVTAVPDEVWEFISGNPDASFNVSQDGQIIGAECSGDDAKQILSQNEGANLQVEIASDPHAEQVVDESILKPLEHGANVAASGGSLDDNPYLADSPPGRDWMKGFHGHHGRAEELDEVETEDMLSAIDSDVIEPSLDSGLEDEVDGCTGSLDGAHAFENGICTQCGHAEEVDEGNFDDDRDLDVFDVMAPRISR